MNELIEKRLEEKEDDTVPSPLEEILNSVKILSGEKCTWRFLIMALLLYPGMKMSLAALNIEIVKISKEMSENCWHGYRCE